MAQEIEKKKKDLHELDKRIRNSMTTIFTKEWEESGWENEKCYMRWYRNSKWMKTTVWVKNKSYIAATNEFCRDDVATSSRRRRDDVATTSRRRRDDVVAV